MMFRRIAWMRTLCLLFGYALSSFTFKGYAQPYSVSSPQGFLTVTFDLKNGMPTYRVSYGRNMVVYSSALGFELKDQAALVGPFKLVERTKTQTSETWQPVWGQKATVENKYREQMIRLQEVNAPNRILILYFRAYEDGFAFRYEFPDQPNLKDFTLLAEQTEFKLTGNHTAWWIPGDWNTGEYWFNKTKLSEIDATPHLWQADWGHVPDKNAVQTPFTMKTVEGLYLSLHEAALYDYPAMTLSVDRATNTLRTALVGSPDGSKAKLSTPFKTPWRFGIVSNRAASLIESHLMYNLNEPNKLTDTSWIKPMKYMGIWWEMHLGKGTWDLASGKHAATTANAKRYLDFAARYQIPAVLIEGWNTGWEKWYGNDRPHEPFDFTTPYADFDLREVVAYGKAKGVSIMGHHETAALPLAYEKHMDRAYALYKEVGIPAVKTGYVGKPRPEGWHQGSQEMVRHYQKTIEKTAAAGLMLNIHEPVHPTGLSRTYPNLMSGEGMTGQEFNAWSKGNPPNHHTILPFTRNLAGPMDFTPGIFDLKLLNSRNQGQAADAKPEFRVRNTLANQLALYVVFYSPIQMLADLPENYQDHPAFKFILDVAVDWEETKVLDAEIGEYVTIARKAKGGTDWFLGSVTNEVARNQSVKLSFLNPSQTYVATLYLDGENADWDLNPMSYKIRQFLVTSRDVLKLYLASGGGAAIRFTPASAIDLQTMPKLP